MVWLGGGGRVRERTVADPKEVGKVTTPPPFPFDIKKNTRKKE